MVKKGNRCYLNQNTEITIFNNRGVVFISSSFNNVLDVLENYKSAIFEKDVERFVSPYASDIHIYDCCGKWESIGISH